MKNIQKEKNLEKSLYSHYNFLKGRIAEAIVERLFISLNMVPIHNGIEFRHPDIAHMRRNGQVSEERIKNIEFGSDFIIRSAERNQNGEYEVYQVEVKFSKDNKCDLRRLEIYNNEEMIFIFVGFEGFWCATKKEIKEVSMLNNIKIIDYSSLNELKDHSLFSFNDAEKEIISAFSEFTQATLSQIEESKSFKNRLRAFFPKKENEEILF